MILTCLALTGACKGKKEAPKVQPPVPVLVARAVTKDVPVTLHAIGTAEAYSTVSVKSLIAGEVTRVHFKEGQDVRKGAVLFEIDSRPLKAALDQAEANLAKDTVQAKNAAVDEARYAELYKKGIVSQQQYDQSRTASDTAHASAEADKAAVSAARVNLGYCIIRSPISGRTGNLNVHEGNVVKANDTPYLVVINQVQPINVAFFVPEQYLPVIKKNMAPGKLRVEAAAAGDEGRPAEGALSFVDNAVDAATGTIKLKAVFENRDRRLWPGQYVNVALSLYTIANATLVPTEAVQTGQQGQFVFVVKPDGAVDIRPIGTGIAYEGWTVVEKGISPGETVVTDGQLRLVPGAKVELKAGLK